MQGEPGVNEVGRPSDVLVGHKACTDDLDVAEPQSPGLGLKLVQHQRRQINSDHTSACRRDFNTELPRPCPELDDEGLSRQTQVNEESDFTGSARVLLGVVTRDVARVEVSLPA